jgi:hypothetical protein
MFGSTVKLTVPGPVTLVGDCRLTHPVAPSTDHEHCESVSTVTAPGPSALLKAWSRPESANEQTGVGFAGFDLSHAFVAISTAAAMPSATLAVRIVLHDVCMTPRRSGTQRE